MHETLRWPPDESRRTDCFACSTKFTDMSDGLQSDQIRFALLQTNPVVGAIDDNVAELSRAYAAGVGQGCKLAIAPELAICGYLPEDALLSSEFRDRCWHGVESLAKRVGNVPLVVGTPTPQRHNGISFLHQGEIRWTYAKRHLPNTDVFDECRYFVPGDQPSPVVALGGRTVAFVVCEDLWQLEDDAVPPEANTLVVCNASPFSEGRRDERQKVVQDVARRTGATVVYVNLVGGQDDLVFDGGSFVVNGEGTLTHQGAAFVESVEIADLDATQPVANHEDQNADVYAALVLALRDYVTKNGFTAVGLGLSGGIDSALVATLAVDALGSDAVHAVAMPSKYSSEESLRDARAVAEALGIDLCILPICDAHEITTNSLLSLCEGSIEGLADENLQSRLRGLFLMALSNRWGWLILAPGNKSEFSVGYSTLYGDSVGGFAPLKDLTKTQVYQLCRWRNSSAEATAQTPPVPDSVLTKAPTAELRPNQRDDQSLPPYEVLDPILEELVTKGRSAREAHLQLGADFDQKTIEQVAQLIRRAEYKRRQVPPGPRVTAKAFGRGRRFPLTWSG